MKKILAAVLCLVLLCGCKSTRNVISQNGKFLVSAIGIDMKKGNVLVSLEAVVVNSQDSEQSPEANIFEGDGGTFTLALNSATLKSAKPLDFSHCAMIILGENLEERVKNDIYKFCRKNEQITVSVGFAETKSANGLLKLKPVSDIAVGYEIASMLETVNSEQGTAFNNRFFEIEDLRLKGKKHKPLPFFKVEQDIFYIEGDEN